MSKRNIHKLLQETVEEEIPAGSVDLWPQISQQIEIKPASAPKRRRAIRLVYRVAIVLLVGAAVFLMTPQGRTFAQEYLLQFFKRADANSYPIPSEAFVTVTAQAMVRATETQFATEYPEIPTSTPTITPTPEPGTYMAATQTVPEIEEQLGFDVLEPGWLPDLVGYSSGASADLERGIAYQFYGIAIRSNGLTISQYSADLDMDQPEIGASTHVSIVDINGYTGEYVRGTWMSSSTGNEWVYRPDPYLQRLRWEQDGMIFELMFFGPMNYMMKDDMIAVAESMH